MLFWSRFIIYISNSEQFNVFWIKSKTNWVQNHWIVLYFLNYIINWFKYAFKKIIYVKLHPFQKLLKRPNFEQLENKELQMNFL